jgi:hypothetical protein
MRTIRARIRGVGLGILLHNPASMGQSNGKRVIPSAQEEAEAGCYWTDAKKKSLALPAWNLSRALVKAAIPYKDGKIRMAGAVAANVVIEPDMLSFHTKAYTIDTRRAIVQRQGILRSRPLLKDWTLDFDVLVDEGISTKAFPLLRAICEDAGQRVGIGDFRIEKNGPFGKFIVEAWEVQ